jgi:glycosyltransferase involved in cell wall biosynthesis
MSERAAARVAIDARKLRDYGIGASISGLLRGLTIIGLEEQLLLLQAPGARPPVAAPPCVRVEARSAGYSIREHFELPRLARRHGATLYHAPHYVLPRTLRIPATVVIHDLIHLRFPEYFSRATRIYARLVIGDAYRRARRVITPSEATKRDVLQAFGGEAERIVVVHNGLDDRWFDPLPPAAASSLRSLDLPERYLLYVGNLKPHKNLDRLVEAFGMLVMNGALERECLVLAGMEVRAATPLLERAARAGIGDRVRCLGRLGFSELRGVMRAARVFAFPSLAEGFGMPPLEAMASGVPVLAADAGAMPEVCDSAALLVDPLQVDSIADGLARLFGDGLFRAALIERGRHRARDFTVEEQARRTLEVWRAVARE